MQEEDFKCTFSVIADIPDSDDEEDHTSFGSFESMSSSMQSIQFNNLETQVKLKLTVSKNPEK